MPMSIILIIYKNLIVDNYFKERFHNKNISNNSLIPTFLCVANFFFSDWLLKN